MTESDRKRAEKIGAYAEQGDIRIEKLYLDQREERAQLNSIPQNVPMRGATKFVGRETELATIHQEMQTSDRVIISAIAGMGGVGKTELAIRYAVRNAEAYPGGICWLNGTQTDLFEQVITFARTVLSLKLPPALEKSLTTIEQQFVWYREHWQPSGAVLLIVDDVAEMKNLRSLLQHLPPRFKVLLTTRRKRLDAGFKETPLDVLPLTEAIELLAKLIGNSRVEAERATAEDLCEWLGRLPLGVELIGRYVAPKPFLSLVDLKAQVQLQHRALDDRDPNYVMTAQNGVRAAFELSWQELGDAALAMGRFLSLFAAAEIPCELVQRVTAALGWATETMEEAREQLAIRHLLQEVTLTGFRLHPLMREFFALKLDESENGEEVRSVYVKALVEVAAEIPHIITLTQVAQFSPAIPHLKAIATSNLRLVPDEKLKDLFVGLAAFYYGQGAYAAAEPWQKKGVEVLRDRLGEDHPDYLTTLHNLAFLYESQGRYGDAEPLYLKVRDIKKQVLGEEHPSYLITLHNLAGLYQSQGRYGDAEPLYLKVRDIKKQVLGEEHPSYLTTLNNLAGLHQSQGRYGDAEPLYLKVRDIEKQVLGEEHPSYLITLHNLAGLYFSQANFLKFPNATLLYIQVLKIEAKVLGWKHPSTRGSIQNLAGMLFFEVVLGWALINFAIFFFQHPSWFALLRSVGYLFLAWILLRQTLTNRIGNLFRRTWATRNQKRR